MRLISVAGDRHQPGDWADEVERHSGQLRAGATLLLCATTNDAHRLVSVDGQRVDVQLVLKAGNVEFPERFAIRFALFIGALVFLMGATLNSGTNNQGNEWIGASVEIWWHLCKMSVFPIWIIMRVWTLVGGVTAGRRS